MIPKWTCQAESLCDTKISSSSSMVVFLSLFVCLFLFFFSLGNSHKECVQYCLHSYSTLPTYRKERIINTSLFYRILTYCVGAELSGNDKPALSVYFTAYLSRKETLCTPCLLPFLSSTILLSLVVPPYPQLFSVLSVRSIPIPKGVELREREGCWWFGRQGV